MLVNSIEQKGISFHLFQVEVEHSDATGLGLVIDEDSSSDSEDSCEYHAFNAIIA